MAILSLDAIFNAGRVQQGLAAMSNRLAAVGRNLRGVESTADRARRALRGMNTEQLNASKVQGFGQGGFSSIENAEGFGITGFGRGKGPGLFSTFEEPQRILDDYRRSLERVTQATDRQSTAGKKSTEVNRRQGVSFTQLLGLMIKFGIAMQLINIPGRIAGIFGEIVRGGAESEASLAGVNALLRVSRDEIMDLGRATRFLGADFGITGNVFGALEEAASSLGGFPFSQVRKMENGITLANEELQTTIGLFELAAKAAVAGGVDIDDSMRAATSITAGFGVTVEEAEAFMDILFKTVDKGRIQMDVLSRSFGELTGGMQLLFGNEPVRQLKEFRDVMTGIAVSTQTLGEAESFTAQRNLLKGFVDTSAESTKLRNELKGLGVSLTVNDIITQGYAGTLREINRTIAPQGTIIDDLVKTQKEQVEIMGEANFRQARWVEIITTLFPNIRQIRSIQAQLNDEMRLYNAFSKDMAGFIGETNRQFAIQQDTLTNAIASFKQLISLVKEELFANLGVPLANALRQVNEAIGDIISTDRFTSADFIGKLGILWEGFVTAFDKWWTSGGREKVDSITTQISERLTLGIIGFFEDTRTTDTFIQVGTTIGVSIGTGIINGVIKSITDLPNRIKEDPIGKFTQAARISSFIQQPGSSINRQIQQEVISDQLDRREVTGTNRTLQQIFIDGIQIGDIADLSQIIMDLSTGLDDGPVTPRDDRINNP